MVVVVVTQHLEEQHKGKNILSGNFKCSVFKSAQQTSAKGPAAVFHSQMEKDKKGDRRERREVNLKVRIA